MASIKYEDLFPDILPLAQGCPDPLIINSVRSTAIDFCERTGAYQIELDPVTTVAGIHEYDLEPPSGYVVHNITVMTLEGRDLEALTSALVEQRYPKWRDTTGTPEVYIKQSRGVFHLVPVPNAKSVSGIRIRAQLKPTSTSTACDSEILDEFRDTIVSGALNRILRIPNREWSDLRTEAVYSQLFNEGLVNAERRARGADERVAYKVGYGGVYTKRNTGKYATRRIFRSGSY